VAPLFRISPPEQVKKAFSSIMLLCIIYQIATGFIENVEVNLQELR